MQRAFYFFGGLLLVSGYLGIQVKHDAQAAPKRSTTAVECVITGGDFKGNGFIYEINENRTNVRLLEAFEILDNGTRSNFNENADMLFISNKNDVLTFADTRLREEQGIVYTEELDLNSLTLTTLTTEIVGGSEKVTETDYSKCKII